MIVGLLLGDCGVIAEVIAEVIAKALAEDRWFGETESLTHRSSFVVGSGHGWR